jgi:hypothetical protein
MPEVKGRDKRRKGKEEKIKKNRQVSSNRFCFGLFLFLVKMRQKVFLALFLGLLMCA